MIASRMNKADFVRKFLIAGNWKMHGSLGQINSLIDGIKQGTKAFSDIDILVCPTLVHLAQVHQLLAHTPIMCGAQNFYMGQQGAFTGEVSGAMLKEIGCQYVLVGHSERRSIFQEDLSLVAAKFKSALDAGLKPILCIGETRAQRENGETQKVIQDQLTSVIELLGAAGFTDAVRSGAVIAYEPVWAIGTGLTATPEQAQEVHAFIRAQLAQINVDMAKTIRILYGGSMKAENAAALLAMPDIDGGLIGGASLEATSFVAICAAAHQEMMAAQAS